MAEGLLGGILGGDEGEDAEAESAAVGADPVAAAMAVDAARFDPVLSRKAGEYLDEQKRLARIQSEHLHEQREVQLSHLKLRRFTDRLKAAIQVFVTAVAAMVGVGLAVMILDAFASRAVVVEAFKAPSALASRGLTGDVVAAGVLDGLQKLEDATRASRKGLAARSAWSSEVKIEVPETGVSVGEINRLLHERFGHDLHIDGDLIQTAGGRLALTIRGDGVPARTFSGSETDLDKLTTQAAEYVYGQSQPLQFATFLVGGDRNADALAFLPGAFERATSDDERAELANTWANSLMNLNKPDAAIEKYRLAMSLKPNFWKPWGNLVTALQISQGEEAAWRESRAELDAAAKAPRAKQPELRFLGSPAAIVWDMPLALASELEDASHNGGAGATSAPDGPQLADVYGLMHDPAKVARYMAASDPQDRLTKAEAPVLPIYAAMDHGGGDWPALTPPLEALWIAWQGDPVLKSYAPDYPCFLGYAYGMAGRIAEAELVFKTFGAYSRCNALHGDALAHAGDVAGAERVWAEGLKIAPDLPLIYMHRGLFALNRGDLGAAEADLRAAHAKAPHFADPLKAWGDLLARQGRWKEALARYDEALIYAPAWAELRRARDAATRRA